MPTSVRLACTSVPFFFAQSTHRFVVGRISSLAFGMTLPQISHFTTILLGPFLLRSAVPAGLKAPMPEHLCHSTRPRQARASFSVTIVISTPDFQFLHAAHEGPACAIPRCRRAPATPLPRIWSRHVRAASVALSICGCEPHRSPSGFGWLRVLHSRGLAPSGAQRQRPGPDSAEACCKPAQTCKPTPGRAHDTRWGCETQKAGDLRPLENPGGPTWDRTRDRPVMSRLLYR